MPSYMYQDVADESFMEVFDTSAANSKILMKKDSLGSAKQISIDPISLRESSNKQLQKDPTFLTPPKNRFLSQSLPNSASSSPRYASNMLKKKPKNQIHPSSLSILCNQDSVALANLERLREMRLHKSKSCGEGRSSGPPDDFEVWFSPANVVQNENKHDNTISAYYKFEAKKEDTTKQWEENMFTDEEKFKCKALCLYLPGFSKAKIVKARRQEPGSAEGEHPEAQRQESGVAKGGHMVSKRVSLEKFDCGSWMNDNDNDNANDDMDESNHYFDLPLELIRCSVSDTHSPVATAFVFPKEPKSVLKKSTPKKSNESVRHVRFSTNTSFSSNPTSPTCITPRLRQARDDFNAFLQAQSV